MRYKYLILIAFFIVSIKIRSQVPIIATAWKDQVTSYEELVPIDKNNFLQYDYSSIFSNQNRFKGDLWSSYIGVFGPKNTRIEFHLQAIKSTDETYQIKGFSKLGKNIRSLEGLFKIKNFFKSENRDICFMLFEYNLKEPGDRNGDGYFTGIGSIVFQVSDNDNTVNIFWAASGELRKYNNVFAGTWNRYNSKVSRECVFSFSPTGFAQLPFREYFYKEFEEDDECKCNYDIKEEFMKYGWEGYYGGSKDDWWYDLEVFFE
ncbi:hypothetical protein [Aquimarina sp. I32.4]|uniref:hypothetical protein n=1 Tax=Aquimarina sp. I32.4 TaxID=2053903 RepID=UPI000CDE902B|nr:hypothetical protein [Aquimarina sp. I32.4]